MYFNDAVRTFRDNQFWLPLALRTCCVLVFCLITVLMSTDGRGLSRQEGPVALNHAPPSSDTAGVTATGGLGVNSDLMASSERETNPFLLFLSSRTAQVTACFLRSEAERAETAQEQHLVSSPVVSLAHLFLLVESAQLLC